MTDAEAFERRSGRPAPDGLDMGGILTHRSVRDFVPHALPDGAEVRLCAAAQSASTSSNLQMWSVVSFTSPEGKARMAALCSEQKQIAECGIFLAFIADVHRAASTVPDSPVHDSAEVLLTAVIDASLAAERLSVAAEAEGLGVCYIGALRNDPAAVAAELGLPERTFGLFGLCVGVPLPDAAGTVKPRLSPSAVWFSEKYDPAPDLTDSDRRHSEYVASEGMRGSGEWTSRTARRLSPDSLGSREGMLDWLRSVGLLRR